MEDGIAIVIMEGCWDCPSMFCFAMWVMRGDIIRGRVEGHEAGDILRASRKIGRVFGVYMDHAFVPYTGGKVHALVSVSVKKSVQF